MKELDIAEAALNFKDPAELIYKKLEGWFEAAVKLFPNIVIAISVLLLFFGIAALMQRVSRNIFAKTFHSYTVANLSAFLIKISVVALGLLLFMGILGLDKALFSLLASVGVAGIVFGFAFQNIAENLIAGFMLGVYKPFRMNDLIEVTGHLGRVRALTLRNLTMENLDGQTITIPNKDVLQNTVKNYPNSGLLRIVLDVGVSYSEDLDKVCRVTKDALSELDFVNPTKPVEVLAQEFGESSINFKVRFWITYPNSRGAAIKHLAVMAIKKAYDKNNIVIPFPIRTIDFGIKGGENLSDQLLKAR